ncbi:outer membrane beta-barrel protein [Dokdonella sp.]|uniref:outer membrane beta-barrel protein n=1 Tax=Dokdonella sp. TaxID=2291710 RepID=UPI003528A190
MQNTWNDNCNDLAPSSVVLKRHNKDRGSCMRFHVCIASLVAAGFCVNASGADESTGRWSLGVAAGPAYYNIDSNPLADVHHDRRPTSAESQSIARSIRAAFSFNPYIAVQGTYTDFGSVDYEKIYQCTTPGFSCLHQAFAPIRGQFSAHAMRLSLKGSLPLGQQLELFVSTGASYVEYRNHSAEVPGINGHREIDHTSHEWCPALALGLQWHFARNWSTRLSFDGIWDVSDTSTTGSADLYSLTLGIDYRFGAPN